MLVVATKKEPVTFFLSELVNWLHKKGGYQANAY